MKITPVTSIIKDARGSTKVNTASAIRCVNETGIDAIYIGAVPHIDEQDVEAIGKINAWARANSSKPIPAQGADPELIKRLGDLEAGVLLLLDASMSAAAIIEELLEYFEDRQC
jgi:hypothetical protein